ncbi:MAG TPA: methyltransferase [Roseiarcus sp.]|nr:methyltransferase [Roseiarcus sp.]
MDVGGGSEAYSIAFCAANPELSATILDFPQTIDTAKRCVREADLADRIGHLAGNAVLVDWPETQDVVLMSYVWSAVGEADIAVLAQRAAAALSSGGLLLIHDFMVDDARDGPPFAAWYLVGSMLDNPSAVCLTPSYVEGVLRNAGFRIEKTETILPGITMLTTATKPA